MQQPELPNDENLRLKSLRSLNILDTLPEERFDRLTRLSKRLFNVPIALVSIVDANRQWFKSCMGLSVTETDRDISFCGHTILGDDMLIVNDTKKDKRFADNPLVISEPNIRFYAGCPIKSSDGYKLGTLCIIDNKPRTFDNNDIALLKDIASMAENEIAAIELATIDELTGISNRRGFLTLAEKSLGFCKRNQLTSTLAFLDINQFKHINDTYGHSVGDQALITFADFLRHNLRNYDICARLGGDEFVALFMDAQEADAKSAIDKLKHIVNQFNQNGNQAYNIHFSYGLVEYKPGRGQSITSLLADSDVLMYEDKRLGMSTNYLKELITTQYASQYKTAPNLTNKH